MERGWKSKDSALRDSRKLFDRVPRDVFMRLERHGFSRDQMAIAFDVPRTWVEQAAAAYLEYGDSWMPSPEEEAASAGSLELAPMVAAAVDRYRQEQVEKLRDEPESVTQGRIHRRFMETAVKTYTLVDSRGRRIGW